MKNLFEISTQDEIYDRLQRLRADSTRIWGTMTPSQMLAHCSKAFEVINSEKQTKQSWVGSILCLIPGFKKRYYNDKPWGRNLPTAKDFEIHDVRDFDKEKFKLLEEITLFLHHVKERQSINPHPLFGILSADEWAMGLYKHLDHHFRQFGV